MSSAGVRTAYVNSVVSDGRPLKQNVVRDLVKARFAGGAVDAWVLHCAALEGTELREANPDGKVVFGGKKKFEDRLNGLITNDEWKQCRLRPMTSRGDRTFAGNRHFKLSLDGRTCTFKMLEGGRSAGAKMVWRSVKLYLPETHGNAGEVIRQATTAG